MCPFVLCVAAAKAPRRSLNIVAADEGAMSTKVYHTVNLAILVVTSIIRRSAHLIKSEEHTDRTEDSR